MTDEEIDLHFLEGLVVETESIAIMGINSATSEEFVFDLIAKTDRKSRGKNS